MVKAEGGLGVVYKVGKVIQVWVGKSGVCGGVLVQAVLGGKVYRVGEVIQVGGVERSRGARVCTHSATSVTEPTPPPR